MTESRKGPKGFLVMLPGEIIEIPQDDDKSWLTLFYALPKELVEKFPAALEIPRCPYEVLRTDKYDHIVKNDIMSIFPEKSCRKQKGAKIPATKTDSFLSLRRLGIGISAA